VQVLASAPESSASIAASAAAVSAAPAAQRVQDARPSSVPFIGWTPPSDVVAFIEAAFVPTLLAVAALVLLWIAREARRPRRRRRRRYRM
jgi:hypothetical protein